MFWFAVILVYVLVGYALLQATGTSLKNVVADLALSWFAGTAFLALAVFITYFAWQLEPTGWLLACLLALPVLAFAACARRRWPAIRDSLDRARHTAWWPQRHRVLWVFPMLAAVTALTLVVLHGKNTPTNTDDAVRVRAYSPMLVYQGEDSGRCRSVVLGNGPYVSFVPVPGWRALGTIDHFHVNYLILTSLCFFCLLLYAVACDSGQPEHGLITLGLLTTLPLFLYHLTTTYVDALYSMMFAGAFLFLVLYAQSRREEHLRALAIFVLLTAGIKTEGEIMALTLLAFTLLLLVAGLWRRQAIPWWTVAGLSALVGIYLLVKNIYQPNGLVIMVAKSLHLDFFRGAGRAAAKAARTVPKLTSEHGGRAAKAQVMFWSSLFASGNFGIIFYLMGFSLIYYARVIWRQRLLLPLAVLAAVFGEIYLNAVVVNPRWTLDQSTVHRSVIVLAVSCAVFLGCLWSAAALEPASVPSATDSPGATRAERRRRQREQRRG